VTNLDKPESSEQIIVVENGFLAGYEDPPIGFSNNDIALLKLSEDINFNDYAQPACLPSLGEKWS
jgi:hypothetical protein